MEIKIINKQAKLTLDELIKYQLVNYCFFNNLSLSSTDIDTLKDLVKIGKTELNSFCKNQSERNVINKLSKAGLVIKTKKYLKTIEVNPELQIGSSGNTLLQLKYLYVDEIKES